MTLFNHHQIEALQQAGTDMKAVAPIPFAPPIGPFSEFSKIPSSERWGSYTVHHPKIAYLLPKRLFYSNTGRSYAKRVPRYLDQHFDLPDVVHACSVYPDGYGMIQYCRENDVPLFLVAHGILSNSYDNFPRQVKSKVREALRASTEILCVSEALAERVVELVPDASTSVVPIGAHPEKFPTNRKEELRAELGIDQDSTVVLFVGAFTERKGLKEIIEILPSLDLENTEFVFVGHGGNLRWDLERAVSLSQFSNRRIYWRITSLALRRWFTIADLLLLPSHSEGRPTVIYEAMASKTAVLASNVDGIPEQVVDGVTGTLIPPRDTSEMKSALESLVADREVLLEMGERGYERLIGQGWTWREHAQKVQTIHQSAIE